jgi:hypothetical protein
MPISGTLMMASNLPTQTELTLLDDKDDSVMVEASLMGSIDTRYLPDTEKRLTYLTSISYL